MQASYNVAGENGHDAAAQLEARIRHDALTADPATVQVLDGVSRYVRQAVAQSDDPVSVEIDLTIRTKRRGTTPTHLAPSTGLAAVLPNSAYEARLIEGNPVAPSGAEGAETGEEIAERVLTAMEEAENDALAREIAATLKQDGAQ